MQRTSSQRRRRGFTLVELLVVVAILSLLMSLLIPALASAKAAAQQSACAANMRGIGTGIQSYAADNNDYLNPSSWSLALPGPDGLPGTADDIPRVWYWPDMIVKYLDTGARSYGSSWTVGMQPADGNYRRNAPSFIPSRAFFCASQRGVYGFHYMWNNSATGWAMNTKDVGAVNNGIKMARVKNLAEFAQAMDPATYGWYHLNLVNDGYLRSWADALVHRGVANMVFLDSHVSTVEKAFIQGRADAAYLDRWNYPFATPLN